MDIVFAYPYEIGTDHQIIIWQSPCSFQILSLSDFIQTSNDICRIVCQTPLLTGELSAVIIAYKGLWLGTWWTEGFFKALQESVGFGDFSMTSIAALLRWGRFPLLSPKLLPFLRSLLENYPDQVLLAWVFNEGLLFDLKFSPKTEEENAALRYFLLDNRLTDNLISQLLSRFNIVSSEEISVRSIPNEDILGFLAWARQKIIDISPLLFAFLVKKVVLQVKKEKGIDVASWLVQKTVADILGISDYVFRDVCREMEELRINAAREAGVDEAFIDSGLARRSIHWLKGFPLGKWSRPNILAACSFPYLRKLLCINLINSAYK